MCRFISGNRLLNFIGLFGVCFFILPNNLNKISYTDLCRYLSHTGGSGFNLIDHVKCYVLQDLFLLMLTCVSNPIIPQYDIAEDMKQ